MTDPNYSHEVYEHAVQRLMEDKTVQEMAERLPPDLDLDDLCSPGAAGDHSTGFAAVVNATYDMLTADTDADRALGAVPDALARIWRAHQAARRLIAEKAGNAYLALRGKSYDDYDPHSAENEPDWFHPSPPGPDWTGPSEYQPDEEPPDDWAGYGEGK
jgi:hypothetical protein